MNKRYQTIKRVTITGGAEERGEAREYCKRNGYRIIGIGPRMPSGGRYANFVRFRLIGEKVVAANIDD